MHAVSLLVGHYEGQGTGHNRMELLTLLQMSLHVFNKFIFRL